MSRARTPMPVVGWMLAGVLVAGTTIAGPGAPAPVAVAADQDLVLSGQRFLVTDALDIDYALVSTDPVISDDLARGPAVAIAIDDPADPDDDTGTEDDAPARPVPLPTPDDRVMVRVAVHRGITSRYEVVGALLGDPGAVLDAISRPLVDLVTTDDDGRLRLRLDHPVAARRGPVDRRPNVLEVPAAGLHPVSITIARDGVELARHVTFVDHRPDAPTADAPRLGVSIATAIGAPGASVDDELTTSEMLSVRSDVERLYVLARDVDLPISLALEPRLAPLIASGELLVGLGPEPLDVLLATDGGEIIVLPHRRIDPSGVVAVGEGDLVADALDEGRSLLAGAFGATPIVDGLWVAEERVTSSHLTPAGAGLVRDLGRTSVLMSRDVYLAHGGAAGAMTDATLLAAVEIAPGDTLDAIVLDSSAALLDVGAPSALSPTERAVRVIAEITALRRTGPASDRWFVISGTDLEVPDADVVGHLARMLAEDPTVDAAPLSTAATSTGGMTDAAGRPIVISWPSGPDVDLAGRMGTIESLRALIFDIATLVPIDDPRIAEWERTVDGLLSAAVGDDTIAAVAERIRGEAATIRGSVVLPVGTSFTLTDRNTPLPLLIENRGTVTLRVGVRLVSDKLDVPIEPIDVVLRPGSNTVRIDVTTRTNGTFPVSVEVTSPAGNPVTEPVAITARVNSVSGLGRLVAVGLVLVLSSWWYSHLRNSRASRQSADIDGDTPRSSATATRRSPTTSRIPE